MINPDKTHIIFNPAAAEGLAEKRWRRFQEKLDSASLDYDFSTTEAPAHATRIAQHLVQEGVKRIAVFGGDGTINETIQGLAQFGQQVTADLQLLYFPAGSSCDFARKFPDGRSFVDRFQSTETTKIDICRVDCLDENGQDTSRYFINNSSIGVISAANDLYNNVTGFSRWVKKMSVDAAAVMAGATAIRRHQAIECRIVSDGKEWEGRAISNITVFKTPYFGGGMNYGVECIQDNGQADVVVLESISRLKLLAVIPRLYLGTALNKPEAHHWQCSQLDFYSDQRIPIETDGEVAGYPPARYSVIKQAIGVVL